MKGNLGSRQVNLSLIYMRAAVEHRKRMALSAEMREGGNLEWLSLDLVQNGFSREVAEHRI